jgi:hypothetical protein
MDADGRSLSQCGQCWAIIVVDLPLVDLGDQRMRDGADLTTAARGQHDPGICAGPRVERELDNFFRGLVEAVGLVQLDCEPANASAVAPSAPSFAGSGLCRGGGIPGVG